MPAKSKAQFRFMKGVESGSINAPGLSPEQAAEYTKENKGSKRFSKLKEKLKKKDK